MAAWPRRRAPASLAVPTSPAAHQQGQRAQRALTCSCGSYALSSGSTTTCCVPWTRLSLCACRPKCTTLLPAPGAAVTRCAHHRDGCCPGDQRRRSPWSSSRKGLHGAPPAAAGCTAGVHGGTHPGADMDLGRTARGRTALLDQDLGHQEAQLAVADDGDAVTPALPQHLRAALSAPWGDCQLALGRHPTAARPDRRAAQGSTRAAGARRQRWWGPTVARPACGTCSQAPRRGKCCHQPCRAAVHSAVRPCVSAPPAL